MLFITGCSQYLVLLSMPRRFSEQELGEAIHLVADVVEPFGLRRDPSFDGSWTVDDETFYYELVAKFVMEQHAFKTGDGLSVLVGVHKETGGIGMQIEDRERDTASEPVNRLESALFERFAEQFPGTKADIKRGPSPLRFGL